MSVRLRRLRADYERMRSLFTGRERIRIVKTLGDPPEKYQVEFLINSLQRHPTTGRTRFHGSFMAELTLTGAYPRMAPQCRMLTPVFHPNIAPHAVCIGDHWAAGESLANLVIRMAEMLAYQSYNVKSPLDGEAARWVEHNLEKLPLDTFDFAAYLSVGEATGRDAVTAEADAECANCGKPGPGLQSCRYSHLACDDCLLPCPRCSEPVCLACNLRACAICTQEPCNSCGYSCGSCQRTVCLTHTAPCHVCHESRCADCVVVCSTCLLPMCRAHIPADTPADADAYHCPGAPPATEP